jgi:hypothetical protein
MVCWPVDRVCFMVKPWLSPAPGAATAPSWMAAFAVAAIQVLLSIWRAKLTELANLSCHIAQPSNDTVPTPPVIESMRDFVGGTASTVTVLQPMDVAAPADAPAQTLTE